MIESVENKVFICRVCGVLGDVESGIVFAHLKICRHEGGGLDRKNVPLSFVHLYHFAQQTGGKLLTMLLCHTIID